MPEHTFIRHSKNTTLNNASCSEIKYKKMAEPKNPIEFTTFLTLIILYPLFIKLSVITPPMIREKIETRLGIRIAYTKMLEPKSMPIPPSEIGEFTNFGK